MNKNEVEICEFEMHLKKMDTAGTSSKCSHERESAIAGVYFSKTSVNYFCLGFSCCPYYRSVCYSGVFARRELTVLRTLANEDASSSSLQCPL